MTIPYLEDVTSENISTNYTTVNGVGFCYLDPLEEVLKEFTEDITIPVYPGEESTRQFYILKDSESLLINTLSLKITSASQAYSVKTSLDKDISFENIESNNEVIIFLSKYPSGIIPVTLYIKNVKDTVQAVSLEIEMEVL